MAGVGAAGTVNYPQARRAGQRKVTLHLERGYTCQDLRP